MKTNEQKQTNPTGRVSEFEQRLDGVWYRVGYWTQNADGSPIKRMDAWQYGGETRAQAEASVASRFGRDYLVAEPEAEAPPPAPTRSWIAAAPIAQAPAGDANQAAPRIERGVYVADNRTQGKRVGVVEALIPALGSEFPARASVLWTRDGRGHNLTPYVAGLIEIKNLDVLPDVVDQGDAELQKAVQGSR